jgi:hypothetical protein
MDSVRNLTGSPIAGLDPHELFDTRCAALCCAVLACRPAGVMAVSFCTMRQQPSAVSLLQAGVQVTDAPSEEQFVPAWQRTALLSTFPSAL